LTLKSHRFHAATFETERFVLAILCMFDNC